MDKRMDGYDFDDAMARHLDRRDELEAMWDRLDVLEELVNELYSKLGIEYEWESEVQ